MSSLADRLRGVVGGSASRDEDARRHPPYVHSEEDVRRPGSAGVAVGSADPASDPAEVLGGEWHGVNGHRFLVVDRVYRPGHRHGRVSVADSMPPEDGWPRLELLACGSASHDSNARRHPPYVRPLLFLDLETTGLAGGAGTYAFLVGCGWFDGATFRVRQFFLSSYAAERTLLDAIADVAREARTVVTFNGKSFDLPLIETRFLFYRLQPPFAGKPHVDLLHPARRFWRPDDTDIPQAASCRLMMLEETLLGHVSEDDVPGFEIPSRYFHYVRSGDARPLDRVFEHNRLDILALAMLTARAAQLLEDGPSAAKTAREALALGRTYERGGLMNDAWLCYTRAVEMPADRLTRAEALRCSAVLARRQHRYEEAARAWRALLEMRRCPAHLAREASEALAVHHEHRLRDLQSARRFALQTLQFNITRSRTAEVQRRLARLDRKLGEAALF